MKKRIRSHAKQRISEKNQGIYIAHGDLLLAAAFAMTDDDPTLVDASRKYGELVKHQISWYSPKNPDADSNLVYSIKANALRMMKITIAYLYVRSPKPFYLHLITGGKAIDATGSNDWKRKAKSLTECETAIRSLVLCRLEQLIKSRHPNPNMKDLYPVLSRVMNVKKGSMLNMRTKINKTLSRSPNESAMPALWEAYDESNCTFWVINWQIKRLQRIRLDAECITFCPQCDFEEEGENIEQSCNKCGSTLLVTTAEQMGLVFDLTKRDTYIQLREKELKFRLLRNRAWTLMSPEIVDSPKSDRLLSFASRAATFAADSGTDLETSMRTLMRRAVEDFERQQEPRRRALQSYLFGLYASSERVTIGDGIAKRVMQDIRAAETTVSSSKRSLRVVK